MENIKVGKTEKTVYKLTREINGHSINFMTELSLSSAKKIQQTWNKQYPKNKLTIVRTS